jgi:hypothetical protein
MLMRLPCSLLSICASALICTSTGDLEWLLIGNARAQVGVFGDISKWQRDLARLSTLYDTDEEGGLHSILGGRSQVQILAPTAALAHLPWCSTPQSDLT